MFCFSILWRVFFVCVCLGRLLYFHDIFSPPPIPSHLPLLIINYRDSRQFSCPLLHRLLVLTPFPSMCFFSPRFCFHSRLFLLTPQSHSDFLKMPLLPCHISLRHKTHQNHLHAWHRLSLLVSVQTVFELEVAWMILLYAANC